MCVGGNAGRAFARFQPADEGCVLLSVSDANPIRLPSKLLKALASDFFEVEPGFCIKEVPPLRVST
jgi:hypothetical protein